MTLQRKKSQRLVTTTPKTTIGTALLENAKPKISPKLLDGLPIHRVSGKGTLVPRILTFSDDLFTLFISHHKVGNAESISDRLKYKSFKAYSSIVSFVSGTAVKRDIRMIDVADILFVQSGYIGTRKMENCRDTNLDPTKVVSIFHNNNVATDLQMANDEDVKAVLNAVQTIREVYHTSKLNKVGREDLLLRYAWNDTDCNKNGIIDQAEFLQLLGRINIYLKQEKAIQIFKEYIAQKKRPNKKGGRLGSMKHNHHGISFEECMEILQSIKLSQLNGGKEMSGIIFNEMFGSDTDAVSAEDFISKFLHQKQKENEVTINDVKSIFAELNSMEISGAENCNGKAESIDRIRFGEYLTSARNDCFEPEKQTLDTSTLSRPISDYWINSSHNTYLTGDQLKSLSSVEMYVVAMQRGCKCLELDCWDDAVGYPIVYHGYTLTSKIPFKSIITCVNAYVDAHPDTLPIILSLENHCSHAFQEQMAATLKDALGDKIYVPDKSGSLPSPLELVGKVVIKGKIPPDTEAEEDDLTLTLSESLSIPEDAAQDKKSTLKVSEDRAQSQNSDNMLKASIHEVGDQVKDTLKSSINTVGKAGMAGGEMLMSTVRPKSADTPQLPKICSELAEITLFNGTKFKGFRTSIDLPISDMHSFSETKITKVLNKDPQNVSLWREYNKEHMTRTYPAGSRVDSSNYNPVVSWHLGSQLVALNFQTDDSNMCINDGRFRENGGCGYVHKPPSTLPDSDSGKTMGLRIKVMSGSCLPKPLGESVGEVIDPYVIIRLHDVDVEKSRSLGKSLAKRTTSGQTDWLKTEEWKTKSIQDNGFSCKWNESDYFSFDINNTEVAMLEVIVMDSDAGFLDDTMCKTSIPVSCLRQGIRSVQFYDQCSRQYGPFLMSRLLVDIDIKYGA